MRVIKTQKGFTIVETLIVMAVTGALLFTTALLVSGQISRYSFRESALNMEQRLSDVINDTSSGYFEPKATAPSACGGSNSEAGNSDCVYAGKKIKIDSANMLLVSESLYIGDNEDPFGTPPATLNPISTSEENLPSGLDYANDVEFYVLFNQYGSNISSDVKGSGQSVTVYNVTSPPTKVTDPITIKASNGSRKVVYCVGQNGSPTVFKIFGTDSCL